MASNPKEPLSPLERIARAVDAWTLGDLTSNDAMKFIEVEINKPRAASPLPAEPPATPPFELGRNPNIPRTCNACGRILLLENLYVDDGCPCNSARGVNFTPQPCGLCRLDCCVKPGHRLSQLFGIPAPATPSAAEPQKEE